MVTIRKDKMTNEALGTGRRKTAVARVRIRPGKGVVTVNHKPLNEYFPNEQDQRSLLEPLEESGKRNEVDVVIRVHGGGPTGQSGASRMGIARALVSFDTETFPAMRDNGFLTRDSRMKERKKYGLRGARRGTQFSKR
jgi:small subunit ribosomal protein S9